MGEALAHDLHFEHSPLHEFEHQMKLFVDFGLFFFSFTQAGVVLADIGPMTWLILGSLVIGKTLGISLFGIVAMRLGFPLPDRMGIRELVMAGYVAALGLTVALFVATAAFEDPTLLGQGKMGALFSGWRSDARSGCIARDRSPRSGRPGIARRPGRSHVPLALRETDCPGYTVDRSCYFRVMSGQYAIDPTLTDV
jgi:hypothetical protein